MSPLRRNHLTKMGQLRQISRRAYRLSDRYGRSGAICSLPATAATEVNILRLWDARSTSALDMYLFSEGEYVKSLEQRTMSEVITKVLYPADDHIEGKTLRLKQQYFFLSATAQSIIKTHIKRFGDIKSFSKHHRIQINDTHPALVIPELMRIMMDEYRPRLGRGVGSGEPIGCLHEPHRHERGARKMAAGSGATLLPRVWEILCEINRRWCEYLVSKFGNSEKVGKNLIIQDGQVHMANLCLAACYKINGVSGLHGEILKKDLFKDVCRLRPERFTYVTNGIDHRRWLAQINPRLHGLVSELLEGDDYLTKPEKLIGLLDYAENVDVQRRVNEIKRLNKYDFAKFLAKNRRLCARPRRDTRRSGKAPA